MNIEADDVIREAKTLGMLRHKNVIRYFGLIETDEEFAMVMELAEGGSLADLITITKTSASGQGVQMGEVLEMTGQLSSALDYIHGQGIVHRDVKADNILLAHINCEMLSSVAQRTVPCGLCPGCWCGGLHHQRTQTLAGSAR